MVKCNKYVLLRGRRHAPTFARPPISPALTPCQLFSDSESTRIRSRDVLRHECRMETQIKSLSSVGQYCSCRSKLVEQQRKRWLQQLHCSAAAVVRCSSGGRTRRELRSCVLWNTSGRAEPWGARLWPPALHQIRRAVSNSSYLPPTPLLLFMDIELTLSCLRQLCI